MGVPRRGGSRAEAHPQNPGARTQDQGPTRTRAYLDLYLDLWTKDLGQRGGIIWKGAIRVESDKG